MHCKENQINIPSKFILILKHVKTRNFLYLISIISSAIAILAKSEILAKRLRKELKETKSQEGQIGSYDWKIKYSPTPSQD